MRSRSVDFMQNGLKSEGQWHKDMMDSGESVTKIGIEMSHGAIDRTKLNKTQGQIQGMRTDNIMIEPTSQEMHTLNTEQDL